MTISRKGLVLKNIKETFQYFNNLYRRIMNNIYLITLNRTSQYNTIFILLNKPYFTPQVPVMYFVLQKSMENLL